MLFPDRYNPSLAAQMGIQYLKAMKCLLCSWCLLWTVILVGFNPQPLPAALVSVSVTGDLDYYDDDPMWLYGQQFNTLDPVTLTFTYNDEGPDAYPAQTSNHRLDLTQASNLFSLTLTDQTTALSIDHTDLSSGELIFYQDSFLFDQFALSLDLLNGDYIGFNAFASSLLLNPDLETFGGIGSYDYSDWYQNGFELVGTVPNPNPFDPNPTLESYRDYAVTSSSGPSTPAIPEPGSAALLLAGAGLMLLRRARR